METKFSLGQELNVRGTFGIDATKGAVKVVAVMVREGVPDYEDVDSWVQDLEKDEADEILNAPWYSYVYNDKSVDNSTYTLPEYALEEIVKAAEDEDEAISKFYNEV